MMKNDSLAFRIYPEPNGISYSKFDLVNRTKVIELFNYCQILEATIWDKGWSFLFKNYGLKVIIEIDKESGWLDDEDLGEWITAIYYHSLISGFEPQKMEFGKYFEETGIFINRYGEERKIEWREIYNLKEQLLTIIAKKS